MGIYYRDTRYLSHYELLVGGMRPILLSSTNTDDNSMVISDLANPDLFAGEKLLLHHDTIHVHRSKFLHNGVCHEQIIVRNHGDAPVTLTFEFRFLSDFADIFEVRGAERPRRGTLIEPTAAEDRSRFLMRALMAGG
jgi:glycogen debranching enzyme